MRKSIRLEREIIKLEREKKSCETVEELEAVEKKLGNMLIDFYSACDEEEYMGYRKLKRARLV